MKSMEMVFPVKLRPHPSLHRITIRLPLHPSSPFHKNPNFNILTKAPKQASTHPNPCNVYPRLNNSGLNPPQKFEPDSHGNSYPKHKNLDTTNHLLLKGPTPSDAGLNFRKKIVYLELMGVDTPRAIRDNPSIRSASLSSIEEVVNLLQKWGMLYKDLDRIFGMCPSVLTCNIDKDLTPVFNFLIDELKIERQDIRKCINRCPRILASSVTDQIRPTLYYLLKLGIPKVRFMDCSNTILLVSSVERTLIPKLEYLQSLGFEYNDAVSMVKRAPGIFTFSIINNLQPKFDYLVNEMGRSLEDLLEFPQYFAFSLEKRIKPRHRLLAEHNVSWPLPDMLKKTELDFMHTLKQQLAV